MWNNCVFINNGMNKVKYCILFLIVCTSISCKGKVDPMQNISHVLVENEIIINNIIGRDCRPGDFSVTMISSSGFNPVFYNKPIMAIFDDPVSLPSNVYNICDRLKGSVNTAEFINLLHLMSGISAGGTGPPLSGSLASREFINTTGDPAEILERLSLEVDKGGIGLVIGKEEKDILPGYPKLLREALLQLLSSIAGINTLFESYLQDDPYYLQLLNECNNQSELTTELNKVFDYRELNSNKHKNLLNSADRQILAFSSRLLAESIERAIKSIELYSSGNDKITGGLELETELGNVGVFTEANDTIDGDYFLVIDLGGDDLYTKDCAASVAYEKPISILIDIDGDDQYGRPDSPSLVCSSVFGLSFLTDRSGDDTYYGKEYGPCFSFGGFSYLEDSEGDDRYYNTDGYSLGASLFGYAFLFDRDGSDVYRSGSYSQGFAGLNGISLLLDKLGDDRYLSAGSSFCQGSSKGRWADAGDGFNIGGGLGVMADLSGDDEYLAQSFSQGSSYYFGLGILYDLRGRDTYLAESHSQGSAAHYSLGCLIDEEGNDEYNTKSDSSKLTQIIGHARDHSIAAFTDFSGNDKYHFGNKSFGVGDINSLGLAIEYSGDDRYQW